MVNSSGTVAVVDDDPSTRRSVQRLLNANGFVTEEYASAEAFLTRGSASAVGCVVLDIHLGGMSGIELWHQLKHSETCFPVIFITAVENEALKRGAIKAGCVAYLQKPFPAEALVAAISKALRLTSSD